MYVSGKSPESQMLEATWRILSAHTESGSRLDTKIESLRSSLWWISSFTAAYKSGSSCMTKSNLTCSCIWNCWWISSLVYHCEHVPSLDSWLERHREAICIEIGRDYAVLVQGCSQIYCVNLHENPTFIGIFILRQDNPFDPRQNRGPHNPYAGLNSSVSSDLNLFYSLSCLDNSVSL